jgi:hypothetical protein
MAKLQSTYHVVYDHGSVFGREKKVYTICAQLLAYMSELSPPLYCMTSTKGKIQALLHWVVRNHVLR